MRILTWLLVAVLLIAHQDSWYWNDDTAVFGFLPIGLFYHVCLSVAASISWLIVCTFAWPPDLDEELESDPDKSDKESSVTESSGKEAR